MRTKIESSVLGEKGMKIAQGLEAQARELEGVVKQMRSAAVILSGRAGGGRLSPQGREAISQAARKRWERVRSERLRQRSHGGGKRSAREGV